MSQTPSGLGCPAPRRAAAGKPHTVTVEQACEKTGLGVSTLYVLMKTRKVRSTRVGRRRLLFWASLEQLLEENANSPLQPLPGVSSRWRKGTRTAG